MQLIIIFLIYNLLQILTLPALFAYLIYRKFVGKDILGCWKERIGLVPRVCKTNKKVIWLHAVSVGEVFSIQYLITHIKKSNPDTICYLTVGTSAGKQVAQKNLIDVDYISFIPYDFLPFILLAINRIKPDKIIVVEAEIWPNFLILTSWLKFDKILINARISTRSYNKYKTLKFFFAPIFNLFSKIKTQSAADKERFIQVGVEPGRLTVLGDIKAFNVVQKKMNGDYEPVKIFQQAQGYTKALPDKQNEQCQDERANTHSLLVGSIHPGELDIYLKLFLTLKPTYPELQLILAPRHFTWLQELETKLKDTGVKVWILKPAYALPWLRRGKQVQDDKRDQSQCDQSQRDQVQPDRAQDTSDIPDIPDILAVCQMGQLFSLYQFADIFYLGGTFVNVGGHNLLEPAVWSNPCIIGPYYQNTKSNADEMEQAGGLIKVEDFQQLLAATQKLLQDKDLRIKMGNANNSWVCQKSDFVKNGLDGL